MPVLSILMLRTPGCSSTARAIDPMCPLHIVRVVTDAASEVAHFFCHNSRRVWFVISDATPDRGMRTVFGGAISLPTVLMFLSRTHAFVEAQLDPDDGRGVIFWAYVAVAGCHSREWPPCSFAG